MKRLQVNSVSNRTSVLLKFPTTDPNKKYKLFVEKLVVPSQNSLVLNSPLFTVERRLLQGAEHDILEYTLPVAEEFFTFVPKNVKTISHLLFQMNLFFRELCQRLVAQGLAEDLLVHPEEVPDNFETQAHDWNELLNVNDRLVHLRAALQGVIRTDGKIGIAFSNDAQVLFVLKLTTEGKRIFGHDADYLAVDDNASFETPYRTVVDPDAVPLVYLVNSDIPAAPAAPAVRQTIIQIFHDSIFSHLHYRNELVIQSSLPLNNTLECDNSKSFTKRQIATYRFPSTKPEITYGDSFSLNDRVLHESTQSLYSFEESISTHNKMILTATELQNFTIDLINRNYDKNKVQTEVPYELEADTFFTLQLAVLPL
jgi:hypothetical protein